MCCLVLHFPYPQGAKQAFEAGHGVLLHHRCIWVEFHEIFILKTQSMVFNLKDDKLQLDLGHNLFIEIFKKKLQRYHTHYLIFNDWQHWYFTPSRFHGMILITWWCLFLTYVTFSHIDAEKEVKVFKYFSCPFPLTSYLILNVWYACYSPRT